MSALEASLLRLAHAVGEPQRELTILAEGNVSARLDDERMLVKATGSSLAASRPDDLVECRFEPILELLDDPTAFEGGAVQQHVLRGTRRSTGEEVALHACVVIAVDDQGRISRLDEYFDSAEAARFAP